MSAADGRRGEGVEVARLMQKVDDSRFRAWFVVMLTVALWIPLVLVWREDLAYIRHVEDVAAFHQARANREAIDHDGCRRALSAAVGPGRGPRYYCLIQDNPDSIALRWGPCAEGSP